jgi:hypothetical protein
VARFFYAKELVRPEDVRPYLGDPEKHWRVGYSAAELAMSWIGAGDIPPPVRAVLESCPPFAGARLVEGFFEHQVDLGTRGRPSQTDLMAVTELASGYGILAVEGKVAESFGPVVREWNDGPGKDRRLKSLCGLLELDPDACGDLRYQLFHRAASALLEAKRYGAARALLLVHSFSSVDESIGDYQRFAGAMGLEGAEPNRITDGRDLEGIEFRLGWVRDSPAA